MTADKRCTHRVNQKRLKGDVNENEGLLFYYGTNKDRFNL